jgi:hypothetical protein
MIHLPEIPDGNCNVWLADNAPDREMRMAWVWPVPAVLGPVSVVVVDAPVGMDTEVVLEKTESMMIEFVLTGWSHVPM